MALVGLMALMLMRFMSSAGGMAAASAGANMPGGFVSVWVEAALRFLGVARGVFA